MNGVSRGARLWCLHEQSPVPVVVLDKAPEGWWVALEGDVDDRGFPVTVQRSARHLYATRTQAVDGGKARKKGGVL